jgi:hypothetical protein
LDKTVGVCMDYLALGNNILPTPWLRFCNGSAFERKTLFKTKQKNHFGFGLNKPTVLSLKS